jgi:hypothetical protein
MPERLPRLRGSRGQRSLQRGDSMFTRENLPNYSTFHPYRKKSVTMMSRVEGPFKVQTQEGVVECDDGWVALDEEGWPYPISVSVQEKSYEAAE